MKQVFIALVSLLILSTPFYTAAQGVSFDDFPNPAPKFTNPTTFIGDLIGGTEDTAGLLSIALVFGGFLLLLMLVQGGFTMLTNPTNPQGQEAGRNRITWAVIGFFVLFSAYWIIQILQVIFGINVVGQGPTAGSPACGNTYVSSTPLTEDCSCNTSTHTCGTNMATNSWACYAINPC